MDLSYLKNEEYIDFLERKLLDPLDVVNCKQDFDDLGIVSGNESNTL